MLASLPLLSSVAMANLSTTDFQNAIKQKGWGIDLNDAVSLQHGYKAKPFVCKVLYVIDGDTFKCQNLQNPSDKFSVRLRAIDAPETKQPQGGLSKSALEKLMPPRLPTYAYVYSHKKDRYGRTVGFVVSAYQQNKTWHYNHVTSYMVNNGYVWITSYKNECGNGLDCQVLKQDFNALKASKKGIWAYSNNVEPSQWRKLNK